MVSETGGQEEKDRNTPSKDETRRRRLSGLHHEIVKAVDEVEGVVKNDVESAAMQKQLLQEALITLTEREREIITATYEHYEPGQSQQRRLPQAAVAKICQRFNISPDNLRQIRGRTNAKIRQYVDEHMPTELKGYKP